MHETLFYICGGVLVVSAVCVALVGLKNEDFPGKWLPAIIVWFAVFAIGAGTFAVLHGKEDSKDHDKEYAKAAEKIEYDTGEGPYVKAQEEREAEEKAENGEAEGGESSSGAESGEGAEAEEGAESEGEAAAAGGGDPEAGATVFSENCATCHGMTGHGGAGGPDLRTMPLAQTEEGAIQQVTNGGGGMPPFGGTLSEEEIENVAAYVAQEITGGE